MNEDSRLCLSCGHDVHHCATVGQHCPVTFMGAGGATVCPCPSTSPSSYHCACEGERPLLRNHGPWSCDNDYPSNDPNCCSAPIRFDDGSACSCHKRKGHRGPHSTHNDCGVMDGYNVCGGEPDLCEQHAAWAPDVMRAKEDEMKCKECVESGRESRVYPGLAIRTLMGATALRRGGRPAQREDPNKTTTQFTCSNGHQWSETTP